MVILRQSLHSSRLLTLAPRPPLRIMRGIPSLIPARTEDAQPAAVAATTQRLSRGHVLPPPSGRRSAVFSTAATANGTQASVAAGEPSSLAVTRAYVCGSVSHVSRYRCFCAGNGAAPAADRGYRLPPQEIVDIVDAPPEPLLSFSPDRTKARDCWTPLQRLSLGDYSMACRSLCLLARAPNPICCLAAQLLEGMMVSEICTACWETCVCL